MEIEITPIKWELIKEKWRIEKGHWMISQIVPHPKNNVLVYYSSFLAYTGASCASSQTLADSSSCDLSSVLNTLTL